jgi:hypothetical protein
MMKYWLSIATAVSIVGCYDSQGMIQRVRDDLVQTQLVEVDLGKFFVTLPRDKQTGALGELSLHYFGNVPPYRAEQVQRRAAASEYRLRHETLFALRNTTHEELAEANLATLKQRLRTVANSVLEEAPVESIGIYEIRQVPR